MRSRLFSTLTMVALLAGCTVGPDYQPPHLSAPERWTEGNADAPHVARADSWWDGFHDPILSDLLQKAVSGNKDLKIAGQRIVQARADLRIAESRALPSLGVGGTAESRRQTQTLDWPPPASRGVYPYYQVGFDASWELDFFGGTRRRQEAAQAVVGEAEEAQHAILVSLLAEVADDYFAYRLALVRLRIAQASVVAAQQALQLSSHAYQGGERPRLDMIEAQAHLDAAQADVPSQQAEADNYLHALATLIGVFPEEFKAPAVGSTSLPAPPPMSLSLPSDVIAQRPDIRRAERAYAAANARIGVAVADLYPHFSIPLDFGLTTSSLHQALKVASLAWIAGGTISQSLYSGGRLPAQVDAARAAAESERLNYEQTVLGAFREVEDDLANEATAKARYTALAAEAEQDHQALDNAARLYGKGETGFLPVLDAQRKLYAAQDAAVQSAWTRLRSDIALYKALGGGWQTISASGHLAEPKCSKDCRNNGSSK
ncbi:efflux transporter outer membrane subunit [Methylorubrum populi]|uniref:efflux transporter outer membrane subunit n=1 Tax=Methylorubrum rhodesianum TaxID=29427 RepID=UPI00190D570D|nr:efflux transporter outer membrane subunit [Methylorubrum rhodesianum]MBK3405220.1 efflux transporter outer membrane subunit [Methylorubrum rhodesianum]MBY0140045.1 efflux transporter outer membrane subunit [Methylorubrum populi]